MNKNMKKHDLEFRIVIPAILAVSLLLSCLAPAHAENPPGQQLSLSEGLKIATEENRVLKIATFYRGMAEQDIKVAISQYFPSVNAYANYTTLARQPGVNFGIMSAYTSEREYPSYGVNFHQTVFDFFARESLYRASRESLELTEKDIFRTKNLVALEFINTYFAVLEADKMLAVGQKEVDALASHAQMARNLFDAGTITKNDLLQAEVKLSDAQQRLLTLKNTRKYQAAVINRILTRPLNLEVVLSEPTVDTALAPTLETVWSNAVENRPEIKIADYEIRINELKENAKKAEFLPSFFIEGGYAYSRNRYMIYDDNWSLLFGVKMNVFSGGATRAELSKLKIRSEQLREQRKRIADEVKLEAERYFLDRKSAEENIAVTKEAVKQATENLRINTVRYEEGVGTATDVLDAISLLTLAEKNHYKAAYDLKRAQAGLLYSTGTDLTLSYK
jgi:outer membrane protein